MGIQAELIVSKDRLSDLERRFFWWEPVGVVPRSPERILAQAMSFADFEEILRLEQEVSPDLLVDVMLSAQPGWIDARSWEFWRGRLTRATGRAIPAEAPTRSFDVGPV